MGAAVDGRGSLRAPGGVRNQRSQASYWRSLLHCAPRHPLAPLSFHVYIAFQGGRPFFALKQAQQGYLIKALGVCRRHSASLTCFWFLWRSSLCCFGFLGCSSLCCGAVCAVCSVKLVQERAPHGFDIMPEPGCRNGFEMTSSNRSSSLNAGAVVFAPGKIKIRLAGLTGF